MENGYLKVAKIFLGKNINKKNKMAYKMKGFSGFGNSPAKQKKATRVKNERPSTKKEFEEFKYKAEHQKAPKPGESYLAAVRFDQKTGKLVNVPSAWQVNQKKKQAKAIDKIGQTRVKNSPTKQEGPLPKENPNLKKSEMKDTWIYKGKDLHERAIDLEERASFIEEDISNTDSKGTKQQKKDIKFLDREAAIIRKRLKNKSGGGTGTKPVYDEQGRRDKSKDKVYGVKGPVGVIKKK
jgi:hypothetical protein